LNEVCDVILVGDSLGMTVYGLSDTVDVTLEMMINHGKAVKKAATKTPVILDLPYGTYEKSKEQALANAKKALDETGCDAIKIEVSSDLVETLKFLTTNGIPTIGHVGLLPQQVREIGGYRYFGRNEDEAKEILQTAKEISAAGALALVIEAVPEILAAKITEEISIPTIGIGASAACDGQVLVIDDLLGLNQEFKPKFVKTYANLAQEIARAAQEFRDEVKQKKFPAKEHIV
jgi:3-methyl-2-oxobutanoate hydroxymethyltransferase